MEDAPVNHSEESLTPPSGAVAGVSGLFAISPPVLNPDVLKQLAYNEKMAELGRISAGVVHELNAPLSVIIAASQMIMREEDVSAYVREMIERISSEAQRLSQMTRGLLNFSSHEDTRSDTDVNLVIEFVLDFLNYEASRRGVTLIRMFDFRLPVVAVDGNMLKQIVLNIVMNALQAMEAEGGRLLVETCAPKEGEVSIIISDTGPGIPSDSLARIFEPYFTTKKPGEGTGLGLFVTKTLVENMGGRIKVSSCVGEGTAFAVTFPAGE